MTMIKIDRGYTAASFTITFTYHSRFLVYFFSRSFGGHNLYFVLMLSSSYIWAMFFGFFGFCVCVLSALL